MNREKGKAIGDFNCEPSCISVTQPSGHWILVFLCSLLTLLVPGKVRDRQVARMLTSWFMSLQNDQRRMKANFDLK